jgi:hypothetical protein
MLQDVWAFPPAVGVSLVQHFLLQADRRWQRTAVNGEDKQEKRAVVVKRETADHSPWPPVHQIHVLVARPVAVDLESRDRIAEFLLELPSRPECETPDP